MAAARETRLFVVCALTSEQVRALPSNCTDMLDIQVVKPLLILVDVALLIIEPREIYENMRARKLQTLECLEQLSPNFQDLLSPEGERHHMIFGSLREPIWPPRTWEVTFCCLLLAAMTFECLEQLLPNFQGLPGSEGERHQMIFGSLREPIWPPRAKREFLAFAL